MDVFNVAHWRQTLRSRIATSGAKQTQYVKVDGSTAQKMEEKLKSLASVLKSWQGKKRFHDFFYTSQRDMHPFLSVKIFCRSEGEAMLNKIQNLIHVEGKSFFFFNRMWRGDSFNLFHSLSPDWLLLPYNILKWEFNSMEGNFEDLVEPISAVTVFVINSYIFVMNTMTEKSKVACQ